MFLNNLSRHARLSLEGQCQTLTYKRRDIVYHQGDQPKGVYFIKEGLVGLVGVSGGGAEHLLRLFKKDQVLGHRSLLAEEAYHGTARALENSTLLFLPKEMFFNTCSTLPEIAKTLLRVMAKELGRAETQRMEVSEADVLRRTASAVLYLTDLDPDHNWTRQEIASFCGSTAPSVIRALAELETRGLLLQDGRKITVSNRDALLELGE